MMKKARLRTLESLDGRTRAAQRAHSVIRSFEADLGGDLSPVRLLAVRRAAMLTAIAEDAAARQLAGDVEDPSAMIPLINAARRAVMDLGLNAPFGRSTMHQGARPQADGSETAANLIDFTDLTNRIVRLFKQARETRSPTLIARAKRVRELLETAERRMRSARLGKNNMTMDKSDQID
jgi:hypothetical protein